VRLLSVAPLASLTNLIKVELQGNPLSTESVNVHIPQLEEIGMGITQ